MLLIDKMSNVHNNIRYIYIDIVIKFWSHSRIIHCPFFLCTWCIKTQDYIESSVRGCSSLPASSSRSPNDVAQKQQTHLLHPDHCVQSSASCRHQESLPKTKSSEASNPQFIMFIQIEWSVVLQEPPNPWHVWRSHSNKHNKFLCKSRTSTAQEHLRSRGPKHCQ